MQKSIVLLLIVLLHGVGCTPCANEKDDLKRAQCLRALPKEDIANIPEVKAFLQNNHVYLSLTTSPTRISKILPVLKALDTEHIESIFLNLPERFARDNSTYEIPSHIAEFPKIKIIRSKVDYGPMTKFVPAVDYLKSIGVKDGVIITIDDDIGYPFGVISQLIKTAIINDGVAASVATSSSTFRISHSLWPADNEPGKYHDGAGARRADIVEGWGAIGYRVHIFTDGLVQALKDASAKSKDCFLSDDLTISYTLASHYIPRWFIKNHYTGKVIPFEYGKLEDALHKGAGQDNPKVEGVGGNEAKYRQCFKDLTGSND